MTRKINYLRSLEENYVQQELPKGNLEYWLEHFGMPKENIDNCITQIAQGYGACRYLEGIQHGAEAVNELTKQEQPDTCIFGNTPSESSCKFCGVECALREPKQTGTTSAGLSSKDEAIGLAIMAYLDTKVKHDNDKVCGVSLKVAREWIREKIANKQEQPEVDLEEEMTAYIERHFHIRYDETLEVGNDPLTTHDFEEIARHFAEWGAIHLNARKEE